MRGKLRTAVLGLLVLLGALALLSRRSRRALRATPAPLPEHARLEAAPPSEPIRPGRRKAAPAWVRRASRRVLVAALITACAALPWVVPGVPTMFAANPEVPAVVIPIAEPHDADPDGTDPRRNHRLTPSPRFLRDERLRAAGRPIRVVVPRLDVNSVVLPVSANRGELLPPADPKTLGWWKEGRRAGSRNGAVMLTGHTVSSGGGALDDLADLDPGDLVTVRTTRGQVDYWVTKVRVMSTARFARESGSILSQSGPGRLVLITCDDWNGSEYLSSAVVVGRPVADRPRRTS